MNMNNTTTIELSKDEKRITFSAFGRAIKDCLEAEAYLEKLGPNHDGTRQQVADERVAVQALLERLGNIH